jgi:hypothetical protein
LVELICLEHDSSELKDLQATSNCYLVTSLERPEVERSRINSRLNAIIHVLQLLLIHVYWATRELWLIHWCWR